MKLVFLLTVLVCGVAAQCNTPWQDCGSTEVTINSVSIPNCCAAPCQITRGQSTNFTFSFTPKMDIANMTQSVCGELTITCIKMPGFTSTDVCTYAQPSCPLKTGVKETVTVAVPVDKSFPSITITAKWTLTDSSTNKQVGCFSAVLKLV